MSRRLPRPKPPAWAAAWMTGFRLYLKAKPRPCVDRTIKMYCDNTLFFAGWLAGAHPDVDDWEKVTHLHLREFWVHLDEDRGCAQAGRNAIARSIQAWWKYWAAEEQLPNPMLTAPPPAAPRPGDTLVPVIAQEQMAALLADAEAGRDFESLRDAAMIRLFGGSGGRIMEITGIRLEDVDLEKRRVKVTGKAGKERYLPMSNSCAQAVNRYIRKGRAKHPYAHLPWLWLAVRHRKRSTTGLTTWGVRQAVQRRAERLGIRLWPHMFRHTFASEWLDRGGNESDLMELAGWDSPQMLKIYGREARGRRAARAYDRVMGEAV